MIDKKLNKAHEHFQRIILRKPQPTQENMFRKYIDYESYQMPNQEIEEEYINMFEINQARLREICNNYLCAHNDYLND